MLDKINPKNIILDHINTLYDNRTKKLRFGDFFLFFIVPMIISLVFLNLLYINISENAISVLATSLSIFAALLFNLLLLVYDIVARHENMPPKKGQALREIYANISFSILISIISIIFLIACYLLIDLMDIWSPIIKYWTNFSIYWLLSVFILTLFMVLKRIHILLSKEFS